MSVLEIGTKFQFSDGAMTVGRFQDCNLIAEHAKAMANSGVASASEMKLAATLPFVMVERYCNDHGIEFKEFIGNKEHVKRLCNDPAMAHFRVWKGKL